MPPDSSRKGLFRQWSGHDPSAHGAGNNPASRRILIHPEVKGFLSRSGNIFVPLDFWFQ